jgi:flagellar basal body rod protein FlgG
MAKQVINVGTTANDRKGDSLRAAFTKVNANFDDLYIALGLNADTILNLGAFEFTGSTMSTTDSSSITIDQATTVTSNLTVGGDVLPSVANGGNLGSVSNPWRSLYVSNNTIFIGNTSISVDTSGQVTTPNGFAANQMIVDDFIDLGLGSTLASNEVVDSNNTVVLTAPIDGSAVLISNESTRVSQSSLGVQADLAFIAVHDAEGNLSNWIFNENGNLELPVGGDIVDSNGDSVLGGTGDITFAATTMSAPNEDAIRIEAKDDNGDVRAYFKVDPADGQAEMRALSSPTRTNFSLADSDWVSAQWIADGGTGYLEFTNAPNIISYLDDAPSNLYIRINDGAPVSKGSGSQSDNDISMDTGSDFPPSTTVVTTVEFYYMDESRIEIDYDGSIDIYGDQLDIDIESTNSINIRGSDVDISASTTIRLQNDADDQNIEIITDGDNEQQTWVFGVDGTLTLPEGGDIVDSNGDSVLGGAANEITNTDGEAQPSTYSVSVGTDGVVTMTTSRGVLEFGALPEPGAQSHFHIMRAAGENADLYFGDDFNYVLQRGPEYNGSPAYGVEIGANDNNGGDQQVWRFGTDGWLTVPSDGGLQGPIDENIKIRARDYDDDGFGIQLEVLDDEDTALSRVELERDEFQISFYDNSGLISYNRFTPTYLEIESNIRVVGGSSDYAITGADNNSTLALKVIDSSSVVQGYISLKNSEVKLATGAGANTLTFGSAGLTANNDLAIRVPSGIPSGVANWNDQGGWNQASYTNVATTTSGTGTGLTVNVAAGGAGYININAISINTPGTGYTDGDVITINNENNLPATFTVTVPAKSWTFNDAGAIRSNGTLLLSVPNGIPTGAVTKTTDSNQWEFNAGTNLATTGGTGTGLTVDVVDTGSGYGGISINTPGTGYTDGDIITVTNNSATDSFRISVPAKDWTFSSGGDLTLPASGDIVNSTGVSQLANRVEGSWTVTTGTATYSFTVPMDGTYIMWVKGNIPNGILTWNATLSVTNSNVPAIGTQYAWNYTGGGSPILLTSIPDQIRGAAGTISTDATYAGSTSNRFDFGISNSSGSSQTIYYGYTKI